MNDRRRRRLGWTLATSALIVVGVVVALAKVMTQNEDVVRATALSRSPSPSGIVPETPAVTTPSTSPGPTSTLSRVTFVDLRTGNASPLPALLRSVDRATHFQASPDGARITFDDGTNVFVARSNGRNMRPIAVGVGPSWSPDGKQIVYVTRGLRDIALVDVATGRIKLIVRGREGTYHPNFHPNFSPDGQRILFTTLGPKGIELRTVPTEGGAQTILPLRRAAFATYSPNGKMIAFRKTDFDGDPTQMTDAGVWLGSADGTHSRRVQVLGGGEWMSQVDPQALWPLWSPNGRRIAFQRLYRSGLIVLDVSSGHFTSIGVGTGVSWFDDDTLIVENPMES